MYLNFCTKFDFMMYIFLFKISLLVNSSGSHSFTHFSSKIAFWTFRVALYPCKMDHSIYFASRERNITATERQKYALGLRNSLSVYHSWADNSQICYLVFCKNLNTSRILENFNYRIIESISKWNKNVSKQKGNYTDC